MRDIAKYVGKQIKKFRLKKGMTQKELGFQLGVKHNTISSYESGINEPDQNVLFAIAKALNISVDDLFPPINEGSRSNSESFVAEAKTEYSVNGLVMVPIIGRISCGNGLLAYEDIEGYEPVPKEWLNGGDHFFLRANGDSMVGARIHAGDLLLIRKQPDVDDGDIAAVLIGEEAVLKRVYRNNGQLILQSENPKYPPIFAPPAEARIIGKLRMNVIKF